MSAWRRAVSLAVSMVVAVPVWLALCAFAPARASSAGTVFIATVPSTAGVTLDVRGTVVTTGADGTAMVSLGDINSVASYIHLATRRVPGGSSVMINRIVPAPHVPHESHLSVGLDVTSPVRLTLLQADSHIPPSHVRKLHLHSILGQRLTIDPRRTDRLRLLSRKIHFVHGKLQAQAVTWAVEGVQADPGISVTTTHSRFDPYGHRRWKARLATVAGRVRVTTVPRTPDVQFDLNGTLLTTGPNGVADYPVADLNYVKSSLTLASSTAGRNQVSALRVTKLKTIHTGERRLVAAIDVRRPVGLHFVDSHGRRVPPSAIGEVAMSDGAGTVSTLVGSEIGASTLLLARVADRIGSQWGTRTVTYSLAKVRIDGSNAVFTGTQRFVPQRSPVWTIHLAVFSMKLTVRDALFGSQITTRTVLTRPDHSHTAMTAGTSGPLVMTGLVRGTYNLEIDAAVVGGTTTVLVSRDGDVQLRVITLLDTVVIAIGGAIMLPAAVLLGLATTRRARRRREAVTT